LHTTANDIVRKLEAGGKMFDELGAAYTRKSSEADELFDKNRKLTAELAIFNKQKAKIEAKNMRHLVSRKLVIDLTSGARFELFPSEEESILSLAQMLSMLQPKLAPFEFELVDDLRKEIKDLEEQRVVMLAFHAEALEEMKEDVAKLSAERTKMTAHQDEMAEKMSENLEQLEQLSHNKIKELEENGKSVEEAYQSELTVLRDATEHQASLHTKRLEEVFGMVDKLKQTLNEDDDEELMKLRKDLEGKDKEIKEGLEKKDTQIKELEKKIKKADEEKDTQIKELEEKIKKAEKLNADLVKRQEEQKRENEDKEREKRIKDLEEKLEEKNKKIKELET